MRHGKKINHLGRTSSHRRAMMANMASSLILHKRISTTTAKAKALKTYVEPLITKAKDDHTHSRRIVFSYLQNKEAVAELFRDVAEKVGERAGGYTRILKTGNRPGDNAEMCFLELVDYNETYTTEKPQSGSSKRRRRRGGKKKTQSEQKTSRQQPGEAPDQSKEEARSQKATKDSQKESTDASEGQEERSESKEKQVKAQKSTDDLTETQQEEEKGEKEERKADDASEGEKKE